MDAGRRLPASAHTARPWRIHEIAVDFRLEDVWELPMRGDAADFSRAVATMAALDPEADSPAIVRVLWALRWRIGALLGWDDSADGIGERVTSLRDRLPEDLRDTGGARSATLPFEALYMTDDECASEIANRTVHAVMHLSWVADDAGPFHARMAVLVKPNGPLGDAYLLAIKPFRHLLVYPALMRACDRAWRRSGVHPSASSTA